MGKFLGYVFFVVGALLAAFLWFAPEQDFFPLSGITYWLTLIFGIFLAISGLIKISSSNR